MTDRSQVEQLVKELHAARLAGDLERLCRVFSPDARLRIAGSSDGKPIAIDASRIAAHPTLAFDSGEDLPVEPL